jgi:hypothetical protein
LACEEEEKEEDGFFRIFFVACDDGLEDWWTEIKLTHTAATAGEMG